MKLLLSKNKKKYNYFDDILMAFERTDFSHVAIEINGLVFESIYPQSRMIPLKKWLETYEIKRSYEIECNEYEYFDYAKTLLNKPYSLFQILMIAIELFFNKIGFVFYKKKINNNYKLICTEIVGLILMKYFNLDNCNVESLSLKETENLILKLKAQHGNIR